STDPYVVLRCDGCRAQSTVKKKELDPIWLERFELNVESAEETLVVSVWDWDAGSADDKVGSVSIPM
ncbi:C2 domain-containing protein, partial [Pelagophyceae sp. CCMP2097]